MIYFNKDPNKLNRILMVLSIVPLTYSHHIIYIYIYMLAHGCIYVHDDSDTTCVNDGKTRDRSCQSNLIKQHSTHVRFSTKVGA